MDGVLCVPVGVNGHPGTKDWSCIWHWQWFGPWIGSIYHRGNCNNYCWTFHFAHIQLSGLTLKKGAKSLLSHQLKIVGNTAHSDNTKTSYRPLGRATSLFPAHQFTWTPW